MEPLTILIILGIVVGLKYFLDFWNSGAGNIVKNIFGTAQAIVEGLASAFESMIDSFAKCGSGKNSDGSSISTGAQVGACFEMIGVVLGAVLVVGYLIKRGWNKYGRTGSELMKETEDKIIDQVKDIQNSKLYNELVTSLQDKLKESGMEKQEAKAKAEEITTGQINAIAAKTMSDEARDVSKETSNTQDASKLLEFQATAVASQRNLSTSIKTLPDGVEDKVKETLDENNDKIKESFD
jgi:hypothetical protein